MPFNDFTSSLRFKVSAWYLVTLTAILTVIGIVVCFGIVDDQVHDADTALESALRFAISRMADITSHRDTPAEMASKLAIRLADVEHVGLRAGDDIALVRLVDRSTGQSKYSSRGLRHSVLDSELSRLAPPQPFRAQFAFAGVPGQSRVRTASSQIPGTNLDLQMAVLWDRREADLEGAIVRIAVIILGFLVLSAIGARATVDRALRPVAQVIAKVERLNAEHMTDELLPPSQVSDQELRDLVNALNRMMGRLHTSFERQREFTADAAHELRTPLTIMQGEMELTLKSIRTPDRYVRVIESSLEETKRLSRIVDALGVIARADSDHDGNHSHAIIDLSPLVAEAVEVQRPFAELKEIALKWSDTVGNTAVYADADELFRAATNLIQNAITYTPNGGTVHVCVERDGPNARLTVEDTGVGIASEDLDRVFERFYRADKARVNSGGYGLGLAIVKAVVEAHGGNVSARSVLGEGSAFTIELPVQGE